MPFAVGDVIMVEMRWRWTFAVVCSVGTSGHMQLMNIDHHANLPGPVWTWNPRTAANLHRAIMSFAGPVLCPSR